MSSINTISPDKLARLIGRPDCPHDTLPGVKALVRLAALPCMLSRQEFGSNAADDSCGDFILDGEGVAEAPTVPLGPKMDAGCRLDELGCHPDPVGCSIDDTRGGSISRA